MKIVNGEVVSDGKINDAKKKVEWDAMDIADMVDEINSSFHHADGYLPFGNALKGAPAAIASQAKQLEKIVKDGKRISDSLSNKIDKLL